MFNKQEKTLHILDENSMLMFSVVFAQVCQQVCAQTSCIIYLSGELGVGKTTLVRGFLHTIGYLGIVKSPTYTIVESYTIFGKVIYHFDLYRLRDPEELEFIGVRDYFFGDAICFVEWPEYGARILPSPDLHCYLTFGESEQRIVHLVALTGKGEKIIRSLA